MRSLTVRLGLFLALLTVFRGQAGAQALETVGTRPQGMGGAFVGVADDASAVYWNPAGLAGGAYLSLVLDGTAAKAVPEEGDGRQEAGDRSAWLLAITTPALGLSYYRLHSAAVAPTDGQEGGTFRLDSMVTHHVGATLVQSITDGLAVGATVKLVRGMAGSTDVPAASAEEALEDWDVMGRTSSRFDLDVGLMFTGSAGRAGVVVRNATEPAFETGSGRELLLERQVRAGGSVLLLQNWRLAADIDLTRQRGALEDVREFAIGTESQVTRRLAARAGVRLNTVGDRGRTPAVSVGASYAVLGSVLLDAQVTAGSDEAFRGWGIGARMLF